MSGHGFICAGGPLDGQWWPQRDREMRFEVAVLPEPHVTPSREDELPPKCTVKNHEYRLQEHDVHGAAWVFQS